MEPNVLPLKFLEDVTNYFSETQKIGSGGYGEVYKGVDRNGKEIAVKKLHEMAALDLEQFKNEFSNLTRVQHRNIVRLTGYCDEAKHIVLNINGEIVSAKTIHRYLCFEYLQHRSLDKHLYEESQGFDWLTRFKMIKGISEGLNYLHEGLNEPIFHLDLKPANILLDENMVPKIADFGLSRLFSGTHSYITEVCRGTVDYMPPEFLTKRVISIKYDIFSLGVIMIQIMAGPNGFIKYGDMSPQEFVELVHNNWKQRIGATTNSMEQDCQQVKTCIEIALKCVETERSKRPNTSYIINELKKTETTGMVSSWDHASVCKIGRWGGVGGGLCDVEVAPHFLESLIIGIGEVIYSLQFSYIDSKGQKHIAGPWGGHGPQKASYHHEIQLGRSEYVTEVSGTIGPFGLAQAGVITSLTIITNVRPYGPFGTVRGTPFHAPVQSNGGIVGFFTYAGYYIDAIGIYVKPMLKTVRDEKEEDPLAKIGPWGGNGGRPCDIKVAPRSLQSVTIHSTVVIHSLEFSYLDCDGQKHTAGPWGSPHGKSSTIQFGTSEFVTHVFGTTGQITGSPTDFVTSLTLITNARSYGPFGQGSGTSFEISLDNYSSVAGFFGRAESCLDAIGIYANPEEEPIIERKAGLTKLGPWGGIGGMAHDIGTGPQPHRLESVIIRWDAVIHSIEFLYTDHNGREHRVGPWGGPGGGNAHQIPLQPLEFVQGISGTFGSFGVHQNVVTSLAFATSHGRAYGPYGQGGGTPFNIPVGKEKRGGCVVGFFAHAGSYLEAIGVYVHTY